MKFREKPINKLYAFALAAVFAIALAGCGGGGGTAEEPASMPTAQEMCEDDGGRWNANMTCTTAEELVTERQVAQRGAINSAITTARTAVAGLTDDASDAAIGSADSAVAAAKMAVMDAADLSDGEKSAFNTAIAVIEGNLGTKKTSIMAARDNAYKTMKAAMAKTGKALHAALGPPTTAVGTTGALANIGAPTTLAAAGLTIDAAAGAGALTTDPGPVVLKAGASAGPLGVWSGMDYALSTGTGASKVTNEARVYTNRGPAKSIPFAEGGHTLADGVVAVDETAPTLVMASVFLHSGTQSHPIPSNNIALKVRGTYDGAPGEYSCTGTCTSTNDGKGSPSALGGTWTFKPDAGAMVSRPDAHYLYFGWWVSKDNEGGPTAASAFAGRVGTDPGDSTDGLDTAGNLTEITGSARYVGKAAGKFAMSNPLDGTGNGGHFTADATLEATFSGTNPGVTGTIDSFRLNDRSEDPGWSVSLARGALGTADGSITAPVSDATVWSIDGNKASASGSWSGTMYDEAPGNPPGGDGSNIPTTVTGTFYSEFSTIGRMVGAFGANKQNEQ